MPVAWILAFRYCGVIVKLLGIAACFVNLKVGGSNPLLGSTSTMDVFFITPRSFMVFCKTFYYQEMARIYPPNAQNSGCQIFYFLTFSAERLKFLERTRTWQIFTIQSHAWQLLDYFYSSSQLEDVVINILFLAISSTSFTC